MARYFNQPRRTASGGATTSHCRAAIESLEARQLLSAAAHLAIQAESAAFLESVPQTAQLATFNNAPAGDSAASFQATIKWGDGTHSTGAISDSGNAFTVAGQHAYLRPGAFRLTIVITGAGIRAAHTTTRVTVAAAPVVAASRPIGAVVGRADRFIAGAFTDPAGLAGRGTYHTLIDWGDGRRSRGWLVANDSGGYNVAGAHRYRAAGAFNTSIRITDRRAPAVSASGIASVAAVVATASAQLSATVGVAQASDGSAISVPLGFLGADVQADLETLSAATQLPLSANLSAVGPSLDLLFYTPRGGARADAPSAALPSAENAVEATFQLDASQAASLASASPYVVITTRNGRAIPLALDDYTIGAASATVSLPITTLNQFVAPSDLSGVDLQFGFAASNTLAPVSSYGAVYWDPSTSAFKPFPSNALPDGWDANARTLVATHDLFGDSQSQLGAIDSSGKPVIMDLAESGGYLNAGGSPQVIGFNYDFQADPQSAGAALAQFLNALAGAADGNGNSIQDVDLIGFGAGGAVALSAAGRTSLDIDNVALIGAPIAGTPAASFTVDGVDLYRSAMLDFSGGPESAAAFATTPGETSIFGAVASSFAAGSAELASIDTAFVSHNPLTQVFTVAAANGNLPSDSPFGNAYATMAPTIFGAEPNDAVVPVASAQASDANGNPLLGSQTTAIGPSGTAAGYSALSHAQLNTTSSLFTDLFTAIDARRPTISLSPTTMDLGAVEAGQSASGSVLLSSSGPGRSAADFRIDAFASSAAWLGSDGLTGRLISGEAAQRVSATAQTLNQPLGALSGKVLVYAPDAAASPIPISVNLTVTPRLLVSASTHLILPNQSLALTVVEEDANGNILGNTGRNLQFATSDPNVATVASGVVTGVGPGTATITATDAVNGAIGSFTVTQTAIRISLEPMTSYVGQGDQLAMMAAAIDDDGNPIEITGLSQQWGVSDPSIATVDRHGTVTGVAPGSVTVAVSVSGPGISVDATSAVEVLGLTGLVISPGALTLPFGGNPILLTAIATDSEGDTLQLAAGRLVWTSSNASVVTVDGIGRITPRATGSATVTVRDTTTGVMSGPASLSVANPVAHINLSLASATVTYGQSPLRLTAVALDSHGAPLSVPDDQLIWNSSNAAIAAVDSRGLVSAVGAGVAQITATDSISGIVSAPVVVTSIGPLAHLSLSAPPAIMHVGDPTAALTVSGTDALGNTVTVAAADIAWTSSDSSIARVDSRGNVAAVAVGDARITATYTKNTAVAQSVPVAVYGDIARIELSLDGPAGIALGDFTNDSVTAFDAAGHQITPLPTRLLYYTDAYGVASFDSSGRIVGLSVGNADLDVIDPQTNTYSNTISVWVYDPQADLSDCLAANG